MVQQAAIRVDKCYQVAFIVSVDATEATRRVEPFRSATSLGLGFVPGETIAGAHVAEIQTVHSSPNAVQSVIWSG